MNPWTRARSPIKCGRCRRVIAIGDPVRWSSTARLARCSECARRMFGEDPPDDLSPLPDRNAPAPTLPPYKQPTVQSTLFGDDDRDVKRRAAGDDD